jgi:hypothetical protein
VPASVSGFVSPLPPGRGAISSLTRPSPGGGCARLCSFSAAASRPLAPPSRRALPHTAQRCSVQVQDSELAVISAGTVRRAAMASGVGGRTRHGTTHATGTPASRAVARLEGRRSAAAAWKHRSTARPPPAGAAPARAVAPLLKGPGERAAGQEGLLGPPRCPGAVLVPLLRLTPACSSAAHAVWVRPPGCSACRPAAALAREGVRTTRRRRRALRVWRGSCSRVSAGGTLARYRRACVHAATHGARRLCAPRPAASGPRAGTGHMPAHQPHAAQLPHLPSPPVSVCACRGADVRAAWKAARLRCVLLQCPTRQPDTRSSQAALAAGCCFRARRMARASASSPAVPCRAASRHQRAAYGRVLRGGVRRTSCRRLHPAAGSEPAAIARRKTPRSSCAPRGQGRRGGTAPVAHPARRVLVSARCRIRSSSPRGPAPLVELVYLLSRLLSQIADARVRGRGVAGCDSGR